MAETFSTHWYLPPLILVIPVSQKVKTEAHSVYGSGQENVHITP